MRNPNLIEDLVRYLDLEIPYRIIIKPSLKSGCCGEYVEMRRKGKLIQHRISLAADSFIERSFESLIAHELIHAWQVEWTKETEHHGKEFKRMARNIEQEFGIPSIFIQGTDI